MPVFDLDPNYVIFPDPTKADSSGLLAIGGDLTLEWLVEAYSVGVFPWFNEEDPILWWSPKERAVLVPGEIKISKSMRSVFRNSNWTLKIDSDFESVITRCKKIVRKDQDGTWITDSIINAYVELHNAGLAHSFETWEGENLIGGLYGVSLGNMFFGESMFSEKSNASKFAFISLSNILQKNKFDLIDCQIQNHHLKSLGCIEIPRREYLQMVYVNNLKNTIQGNWADLLIN
ncbi:MAG: leucyl/phenylalanyl-tRNA--protein transferase [Saprospiraceae bacterium]